MMRTLRGRLVLSHILPLLLIIPIVGFALAYLLETQVLLAAFSDELAQHGALTADFARDQPAIWSDASEAQRFVTLFSIRSRSKVMLFDAQGHLLASSEPGYSELLGQSLDLPNLPKALAGEQQVQVAYTREVQAEVVQVLIPVVGPNREIMGVVRLSHYLSDVQGQLVRLRYLIAAVLGAEFLLAVIVGLALALNLGRSLQRVTDAISGVASGREWKALPEEGPEEIRTLLRAFNTLLERLRVLEESRQRLLANLVHELGRPLGALQSGLQALLSGAEQDPELRRELLEGMDTQVQRLHPLLDSLTDLHGQVLGTLELNRQPVALDDWLRRIVSPWRQAAHDQGLHWSTDIPDSLPVLEIDPDRLAQALGNLLSNAVKYTPEGTISVEASVQDRAVAITVRDTGIGIAPSEQEQIFEPFYRSQRDKRFPQGMGLGLSIARDLVLAHGGRLEVESTPDKGSRFTIWLPQTIAPGSAGPEGQTPV
jgi:two-component system sensor histidine kinase BaeS